MKRNRLPKSGSRKREHRMTKISSLKEQVQDFLRSGYMGSLPDRNYDEWVDEFVSDVEDQIKDGKSFDDAVHDIERYKSAEVDEAEPEATVYYSGDEQPYLITHYQDMTEGDFETKWVSTDAWRGYYDAKSSDKWESVHTDNILSYSEDEGELKKFDDELQSRLKDEDIRYARVFTRSSNVFSTGYDFFVEKGKAKQVKEFVKLLADKYRDPAKYQFTALTGTDPSKATETDVKFAKYAGDILSGRKTFEQVKKELKG